MIAGACDSKCSISGYQLLSIYEKVRLNLSIVEIFLTFCHAQLEYIANNAVDVRSCLLKYNCCNCVY